jgi:RNA polymerase sigma-70 factor, ECF subfamily
LPIGACREALVAEDLLMATRLKFVDEACSDLELAHLFAARDPAAVRLVTERNNRRLFRTAWSILKNREDAEDAVQSAYLRAFGAIRGFEGKSRLSTWLTRIVINEGLARLRARKRRMAHQSDSVVFAEDFRDKLMGGSAALGSPAVSLAQSRIRQRLEEAIASLPGPFRLVFILRDVEGLSVAEVAETLDVPEATVKTRHLRARRRLQQELGPALKAVVTGTFPFAGLDCARLTRRILGRICGSNP